jgi:hypothetical protein
VKLQKKTVARTGKKVEIKKKPHLMANAISVNTRLFKICYQLSE